MPLILADRVRDTTTTTGTGTVTLSGTAPTGYQNFSVIGNGNTTYYTINAGSQWEVGIGTYSDVGPALARNTVLESSNGGALVNFTAGVKDVFVTYPSDRAVTTDGVETLTNKTINGSNNTITNVSLTTAVTGTLPVANGGTGVTTSTGTGSAVLSNSPTLVTPTLGAASATSIANGLGSVGAPAYAFTGDLNTGMWSPAVDTLAFSTNGSERLRITSDGSMQLSVGGVSNTHQFLYNESGAEIQLSDATGNGPILIDNSGGLARFYKVGTGGMAVGTTGTGAFQFLTNNTERMRIDSSGNVGIGTSSPGFRLDVSGTGRFTGLTQFDNDVTLNKATLNYLYFNDAMAFSRNGVGERMRIDSSGNVGIGTSSPGKKLTVAASTDQLSLTTGTNELIARASSSEAALYTFQAIPLNFYTNNAERMRIDSSGNVGIGTSSPSSYGRLSVSGNVVLGPLTRNQATTQSVGVWTTGDPADDARANIGFTTVAGAASSSSFITFATNNYGVSGGERMRIDSSGNVGIGTSSPNAAARLDVTSTTSGFLPPRMTTAQRDAIGSPPNGLMLYNTSTDKLQVRAAGSWVDLH